MSRSPAADLLLRRPWPSSTRVNDELEGQRKELFGAEPTGESDCRRVRRRPCFRRSTEVSFDNAEGYDAAPRRSTHSAAEKHRYFRSAAMSSKRFASVVLVGAMSRSFGSFAIAAWVDLRRSNSGPDASRRARSGRRPGPLRAARGRGSRSRCHALTMCAAAAAREVPLSFVRWRR